MKDKKEKDKTFRTTLLIVLIAIASVTAATFAWFSIADNTRLSNINMDITTGKSLRFDLDAHDNFEDYKKTLSFEDIRARILKDTGIDIGEKALEPVTTIDGKSFTYESGNPVSEDSGDYIEYVLHFISSEDMHVHLSSENSEGKTDGTIVSSDNLETPGAMRIGFFTDEDNKVYDPDLGNTLQTVGLLNCFGLLPADRMQYNVNNQLIMLKAGVDYPVTVRIWLEGTDPDCNNNIKESDYTISMRFVGTDEQYKTFD